jgi:segregation and condensation protein A
MKETYDIKLDVFEGPLDLLLTLIEKRKLFINDVSLAEVADDFIDYVEKAEYYPLDQASYFILVASTLVMIKSKSLLPNLELTDEEQSNINELEKRLILYKRYKELSEGIREIYGKRISITPIKRKYYILAPVFAPGDDLTISRLTSLIRDVISRIPKHEDIPQATVRKIVRLEDMIEQLIERVKVNLKTSFSE